MKTFGAILLMLLTAFAPLYFAQQRAAAAAASAKEITPDSVVLYSRVRIAAAGDLMQHTPQIEAAKCADGYDYRPTFRHIAHHFRNADIAIVNLETTLSNEGPYKGYPCFRSPRQVAEAMKDMGVDVVALANNHCCDQSSHGINSTTSIIDSLGMRRIGVFRDSIDYKNNNICYLNHYNISFAIVNYTYGTNGLPTPKGRIVNRIDTIAMARDFAEIAKADVDCVIAVVHWGEEYQRKPNSTQLRLEKFMRRNGVDIIIGSHPHVIQPATCDPKQGITLYSLGNFVSNQSKRYTDGGLIAVIDVTRIADEPLRYSLELIPVWVWRPTYTLLPPAVGDTLRMSSSSRAAYNTFMQDCRLIR